MSFVTAAREIAGADVAAFAALSGDHNPIHQDAEVARHAGFAGPVAHGVLGLSVATGLASQLALTRDSLVALTGVSWRFRAPVYAGDRLVLHLRVSSARVTSRDDRGLVVLAAELKNQHDAVVQDGEFIEVVRRRPHSK